ncbi:LamB/YcsF family protein [Pontibacter flavimaris]|uniref:5-oxoprolinase subunit A n=1 Tax=Pontibacter flavimaris TaxID=1797110 RepID=A0A1Q5PE11_9BACT|nr:5-oxoprolinase subunit PxpA [Pontibacter flavimaris]OKL40382.1 lactam utilization protein LamB [Pontibacter flavimaris]
MRHLSVDLNCDMGEGFGAWHMGNDVELLHHVTSVNIACGFHAGDPSTMKKTVRLALEKGVAIGAHPGLPDLAGFGRREMAVSAEEVYDMVVYQVGALMGFARAEGARLHHVKPHGALYNMAATNAALAEAIATAVSRIDAELILYGLAGSELLKAGEKYSLRTASEVFADRTYQPDGTLTPRRQLNALITNQEEAVQQVLRMVKEGKVQPQQGTELSIKADTICLHGDGQHALSFAKLIRERLTAEGIHFAAI